MQVAAWFGSGSLLDGYYTSNTPLLTALLLTASWTHRASLVP